MPSRTRGCRADLGILVHYHKAQRPRCSSSSYYPSRPNCGARFSPGARLKASIKWSLVSGEKSRHEAAQPYSERAQPIMYGLSALCFYANGPAIEQNGSAASRVVTRYPILADSGLPKFQLPRFCSCIRLAAWPLECFIKSLHLAQESAFPSCLKK
jgi:hypothetical protein